MDLTFKNYFQTDRDLKQLTICSKKMLLAAFEYPKNYRNAIMKIGANRNYLVYLGKELRDKITSSIDLI